MEEPEVKTPTAALDALVQIIARLRGAGGCPWDREQTPRSMVRFLLEEAHELADAVIADDAEHVCEELGDVLFHILFLVHLYAESRRFDLERVCGGIVVKMKRRHPHVFGTAQVADSAEVMHNWQKIKQNEREGARAESLLDAVPASLPSLMRAYAVSERAGRAQFDWQDLEGVLAKLEEELSEFRAAIGSKDADQASDEFGDLLFTLINIARFSGVHPELALSASIQKFERRFRAMERIIDASGRSMESVPQAEKDLVWESVKRAE